MGVKNDAAFPSGDMNGNEKNSLLPWLSTLSDSKYLDAKCLDNLPHTQSQRALVNIVALTWSTPRSVRYGIVRDVDNIFAPPCQQMAFVSLSINADSDERLGRLGWRVLDVINEFIVSIADVAAWVYFLFANDVGCGVDPALMLKLPSSSASVVTPTESNDGRFASRDAAST